MNLLMVSVKGLVFESRTAFAVGCSVELAMHLPGHQRRHKGPAGRPAAVKSEFITSEGIVISCARRAGCVGADPVYEVTLLFPCLRKQQRRKLRHLANLYRHPIRPDAAAETPEGLCGAGLEPAILGLN